jgi:tripeptide aminopeptidase
MRLVTSIAAMALAFLASGASAQTPSPAADAAFQAILTHPKVAKSLDDIKADDARTFEEQKRITEIPAPPYKEKIRAEYYLKRMQELGFKDASIDSEGM